MVLSNLACPEALFTYDVVEEYITNHFPRTYSHSMADRYHVCVINCLMHATHIETIHINFSFHDMCPSYAFQVTSEGLISSCFHVPANIEEKRYFGSAAFTHDT